MKRDPRQLRAYEIAHDDIGTREIAGDTHNEEIISYFADVGHEWVKDDETAWCAAAMGSWLKEAGLPHTGKLNARSYLDWGVPVDQKDARPGDVVVFSRGNPNSWQGHVGFLVRKAGVYWEILGGNQSNAVSIRRYQVSRILGVRRLKPANINRVPLRVIQSPVRFEEVMGHVFGHEGGYVDHPSDPGGATNMGVTRATLADWRQKSVSKEDVRTLTQEEAREIYKARYWDKVRAGEMPPGFDHVLMDASVNSGIGRGPKWLQRALGVTIDGKVGPQTIRAAHASQSRLDVISDACGYRLAFLRSLSTWPTFGKGWERRVDEVERAAFTATRRRVLFKPPTSPRAPLTQLKPKPKVGFFRRLFGWRSAR